LAGAIRFICIHGAGPGASAWSNFKGNVEEFARHYRTIHFGSIAEINAEGTGSIMGQLYFVKYNSGSNLDI
jgi:hypothetical protein